MTEYFVNVKHSHALPEKIMISHGINNVMEISLLTISVKNSHYLKCNRRLEGVIINIHMRFAGGLHF